MLNLRNIFKKICVATVGLVSVFSLAACGETGGNNDNPNAVYDSITSKLTLDKSYDGKNFFTDGVEAATLNVATDGDTATFTTASGETVTIRFYGIDTPESTGGVEKWGKSASKFTAKLLENAKSIVLEASEVPAAKDSYGNRYLGYVWYKGESDTNFKNCNLQVVENGYSTNKCKPTDSYNSIFKEAETFAKSKPLHIWDEKAEDPYYSTAATETDLKDLSENIDKYWNSTEKTGSKVRVEAYLKTVSISTSGTYTYTAGAVIDGTEYTFNVYAGYTSSGLPGFLCLGTKYSLTGTIQEHNGSYQISGLTYVPMKKGGDYVTTLVDDYYLQFNGSIAYQAYYYKSLYGNLTVSDAKVEGTTLTFKGTAKCKKNDESKTFSFTCPVETGFDASTINGKTITTYGCVENDVVSILKYSNITIK